MDVKELILKIANGTRRTPVRVYLKMTEDIEFKNAKVFGCHDKIVFGDWNEIKDVLASHTDLIEDIVIESDCRNSAVPLLDIKDINARIEPGAIIREDVEINNGAIIMMGAILNIGCVIGCDTMIDMGAVIGGRALIGNRVHVGANAVVAGVIEPESAQPVVIDDDVLIGANAVILEGVHVYKGAIIAAGAVVTKDVMENSVVAGMPAIEIKQRSEVETSKIAINKEIRNTSSFNN